MPKARRVTRASMSAWQKTKWARSTPILHSSMLEVSIEKLDFEKKRQKKISMLNLLSFATTTAGRVIEAKGLCLMLLQQQSY